MTKLSRRQIDPHQLKDYINNLWTAFILMDSKEDIRLLFKDLFTSTEYRMFAKRLEIARRLLNGDDYLSIQGGLKVTSHTVGRVSNVLLEKGEGLRKAHSKLLDIENKNSIKRKNYTKHLENQFMRTRRTLLGEGLKIGIKVLDKKISQKIKHKTAKAKLDL